MTLKENLFWNCNSFCFPSNLLQGLSTRYDFSNRKKVWPIILGFFFLIPEQCLLKYVKRSLAPQVLERLLLGVHVTNNLFFIPLSQDSSLQRMCLLVSVCWEIQERFYYALCKLDAETDYVLYSSKTFFLVQPICASFFVVLNG